MHDIHRILIIDDQETIHQDYHKIIGRKVQKELELNDLAASMFGEAAAVDSEFPGFELDDAYQGQEGLAKVRTAIEAGRPYAVAFVDIRMPPGWDGIETVRRIWEVDPELLVILCSAYSDYSWSDINQTLGRSDRFLILKKPFETIEVRQCAMAMVQRWSIARTDVLTELLNRRSYFERLRCCWNTVTSEPLSLLMLDIDYFKRVNDTRGHLAGDETLRQLSRVVRDLVQSPASAARYGGEEFSILLPGTSEVEALAQSEALRAKIAATPIPLADGPLAVTLSIGVATRTPQMQTPCELVDAADQALRVAKQSGRNRVVGFSALNGPAQTINGSCASQNPFAGLIAQQVMSPVMAVLRQDSPISAAIPLFCEHRTYSVPVVDDDGRLVGILAEKDVLQLLLSQQVWNLPIANAMQRHVVSYEEDTPVPLIFDFLQRVSIHRIVIVSEGCPTGLISRTTLLRWFGNWTASQGQQQAPRQQQHWRSTSSQLLNLASRLDGYVAESDDDPIPAIIDTSSKMQALIVELLASSRWDDPQNNHHFVAQQHAFDS